VRSTVARLRLATASVVVGTVLCVLLAGLEARMSYLDGVHDGRLASSTSGSLHPAHIGPPMQTFGFLALAFIGIGIGMFALVRRPWTAAGDHAIELVRAYEALEDGTLETFAALNATVEAKDRYTAGHGLRVTLISLLIGQELSLPQNEIDTLRHAATFHDIGKIAVPDEILQKPGRLNDDEFAAMQVHPVESARICAKLGSLRESVPAIRSHHERIDGTGYPDQLRGEEIPLGARIIAVADTWDAITSDRPYRTGQPAIVALEEVRRVKGTQFDPNVVEAFMEVLAKDPWMFGLTPDEIQAPASGQYPDGRPRSNDDLDLEKGQRARSVPLSKIDWTSGFDDLDIAA